MPSSSAHVVPIVLEERGSAGCSYRLASSARLLVLHGLASGFGWPAAIPHLVGALVRHPLKVTTRPPSRLSRCFHLAKRGHDERAQDPRMKGNGAFKGEAERQGSLVCFRHRSSRGSRHRSSRGRAEAGSHRVRVRLTLGDRV